MGNCRVSVDIATCILISVRLCTRLSAHLAFSLAEILVGVLGIFCDYWCHLYNFDSILGTAQRRSLQKLGISSLGLCIRLEKNRVLVSILLMVLDAVS